MTPGHLLYIPSISVPRSYWAAFHLQSNPLGYYGNGNGCLRLKQEHPLCVQVIADLIRGWSRMGQHSEGPRLHHIHTKYTRTTQPSSWVAFRLPPNTYGYIGNKIACLRLKQKHTLCLQVVGDLIFVRASMGQHSDGIRPPPIRTKYTITTQLFGCISLPAKPSRLLWQ